MPGVKGNNENQVKQIVHLMFSGLAVFNCLKYSVNIFSHNFKHNERKIDRGSKSFCSQCLWST